MRGRLTAGHALAFALGWMLRSGPLGWAIFLTPIVLLGWLWGRFESLPGLVRWLVAVAVVVVLARLLRAQIRPFLEPDPPQPPSSDPWATPREGWR